MPERAATAEPGAAPEKSRMARLKAEHGEQYLPNMPPLECGEHVLGYLWAVGPTLGEAALSHSELRDFQANTGISLSEWEVSTLRCLSIAYLNEMQCATKRDAPAPWQESGEAATLAAVDTRDAIRALSRL